MTSALYEKGNDTTVDLQHCPQCNKKELSMIEIAQEIPFFGKCSLLCSVCLYCKFRKNDVFVKEAGSPTRYTLCIDGLNDINVRVVKNSQASIIIPNMIAVESTAASEGFISNIEGILSRIKGVIEYARDTSTNLLAKKTARKHIAKLNTGKIMLIANLANLSQ